MNPRQTRTAAAGLPEPAPADIIDVEPEDNVYVFDEDDAQAKAFDEFYHAYDEVHAKTRKFLLG